MSDDILNPAFWKARLERCKSIHTDTLHTAVYDCSYAEWLEIQNAHRELLPLLLAPWLGEEKVPRVLDAGCGYGALLECLEGKADYQGIDISPDLINEAWKEYGQRCRRAFMVGNLDAMIFPDGHFDLAIARSIDGMVKQELGFDAWRRMEREILRVADRLVLLGYSNPREYKIIDTWRWTESPGWFDMQRTEIEGVPLLWRRGMGGIIELFDMTVPEEKRGQGIGERLERSVIDDAFGSVYAWFLASNIPIRRLYEKMGFEIVPMPDIYRGEAGCMAVKGFEALMRDKLERRK